ncbi:S-layer homology domain-containing protein [Paenibacillus peoriae]|uniref:S-layer homology domain-containing protein n=1 Tax=Paenibacillus peoriae TaxID=59893 RepID=A0A7H0YA10_9BACL|nr:S-layer homology domain-containing protein [Paenibacillus peoriae]QNR67918.1 S-layer homology domain-containing protein [Paenibacillus peoriae]
MNWSNQKNKLSLPMSILIAVQAFSFTPASHAESANVNLLANGSFEEPAYSSTNWYIVKDSNPSIAWKTSAPDHNIEIWSHSNGGVSAYNGQQHAELNAYYDSTLYQDVETTPGQVLVWHLSHRGNRGTDVMKLQMGAPATFTQPSGKTTLSVSEISGTNITYTKTTNSTGTSTLNSPYSNSFTMSDGNTEWGYYTGYYIVPEGQTTTRFAFTAVSSATGAANTGNFMDDVFFGTAGTPPVATDVSITGTAQAGQTVTGSYTYSDAEGDLENVTGSVYQWYSGSQSDGSDKTPITGATGLTYTITNADSGKYLFFEVTPKAQAGTPTGVSVVSLGLTVIDKRALQNEIDLFDSLIETDYTSESWAGYKEKLDAAKVVFENPNVSQLVVDEARRALETARKELVNPFSDSLKITEPSGDTVKIRKPEVKGVVEVGSEVSVVIKDAKGNEVPNAGGIATVDENGNWSFTPSVDLEDGGYTVEVTAVKDGKKATKEKDLTVSASGPALSINEPSDSTVTESKPAFTGVTEPETKILVELKDENGHVIETREVEIDSNGNWSFIPSTELPDGTYTVDVTAVKGEKVSKASKTIVVDSVVDESSQLSSLELKGSDGTSIGLSPAFNGTTYNYTASTATYSVYLTPTLDSLVGLDPNAKVEISLNNGSWTDAANGTASDSLPLNEGTNTIVVKVTANGRETLYTLTVFRAFKGGNNSGNDDDDDDKGSSGSGSGGGGGGSTTPTVTPETPKGALDVTLNGNDNPFATGTVSTTGGRTVTSVKGNPDKLTDAASQGTAQKLAIHSPNEGDMTVDGLTADNLKQLSDKGASLEVSNLLAIYPVPAGKMNLSSVADKLGNAALSDIGVRIDIKRSAEGVITSAKSKAAATGYELLVDPVDLDLTFSRAGQTMRSDQLNGYAVKYIALPEGIDPNRITTGVIVNPDGSVYHMPTVVTKINNRYFAQINDLRSNGTYSVIWNPQDFDDVKTHWGREDVNNIAARLDLKGNGNNTFSPDRSVTRSEFAEIVVTGLGLMRPDAPQPYFPDVSASAWYEKAVTIANEFDIVRGYEDGNFYSDKQITREQGFSMIARAYRLIQSEAAAGQDTSALSQYGDGASVSNWAKADVAQLIEAGIIQGNGAKLSPQATMTRAEVTALIARMLKTTNLIDK